MKNINLLNFKNFFYSNNLNFKKKFFLCPFHKEKTPSFLFNNNEKYFYCFSCKKYINKYNSNIILNNDKNYNHINKKSNYNNINNFYFNSIFKKKIINLNNFLKKNFLKKNFFF